MIDVPAETRGGWPIISQRKGEIYLLLTCRRVVSSSTILAKNEREFLGNSGASMHMVSKRDVNYAELETIRISKNPTMAMTANGDVLTKGGDGVRHKASWKYTYSSFT